MCALYYNDMSEVADHMNRERNCYMRSEEILSKVDHTLLKPDASWESIVRLCEEA